MNKRIPLQIVEGRLMLTTLVECSSLRIHKQIMDFVIDTGSPDSYFSEKDVIKLQIPLSGKPPKDEVDFGGSRYKQIELPKIKIYILTEDNQKNEYIESDVSICALKTTKTSLKNILAAQQLPSILGMDFLRQQKFSLHVILTEDMAFLQYEG